jgi:hypothetical protein
MDLTRLRPVFEHAGPYLTVHAEVGRTTESAAAQQESRWTTVRHELERAHADDRLVSEVGRRLQENTHADGAVRRTLVTTGDQVLLDEVQVGETHWPEVLDRDELPDLAAWAAAEDRAIPFVLVITDRLGADVQAYRALAGGVAEQETVTGSETFYITKVPQGDWAQPQFQQTAENAWEQNARLVADEARTLARRYGAALVLVAGEVRARAEVTRALESHDTGSIGTVVQVESGGRAEGSSYEALWAEVRAHLAEAEREADAEVAGLLEEARGRGEGAATGLDEVLEALRKAQVDRLVLDLQALSERTVTAADLDGVPLPEPAASSDDLPADRALLAAGALTGARLTVLPKSLARGGGASALLRWSEPIAR